MSVTVYEVLEIYDVNRRPLGKYRCVCWPDDEPTNVEGLCTHSHSTLEEALNCQIVVGIIEEQFRERPSGIKDRPI